MINEKYNELLQAIAQIIAEKNLEREHLKAEINKLKALLNDADKDKKKGK